MSSVKKHKNSFSRLFEIAGEKKYFLIISGVFSVINALLMLIPYLASFFILEELILNYSNFELVDRDLILRWGIITIISIILGMISAYAAFMLSHLAAYRILYNTRLALSRHIATLSLGFLNKNSIGSVKKTIQENVEKLEGFIAHNIPDIIISLTTAIAMLVLMFYINITLSVIFVICIIVSFLAQYIFMIGESAKTSVKQYYNALEEINNQSIEYIRGMPTVKVFGKNIYSFKKFYNSIIFYRDFTLKYTDKFQNGYTFFKIISFSTLSIIVPIGVYLYLNGNNNSEFILSFLFFIILTPAITSPLMRLTYLFSSVRDLNEGVERIDKIFLEQPLKEPKIGIIPTKFDIEFENVSFSYKKEFNFALKNVSFKANGATALVGPSGGGKSTILNLLARFYDAQSGNIKIGGVNILDIPLENLMQMVAFVFQDNFLFFDSVINNIKIAKSDASFDEVVKVCKLAQCDEFIRKLPNEYDTLIGEGGVYLSGGEEQRICLARALLKDSPILVLDEASSFSDAYNESQIQKALKEISKNKIIFMIAHRLYLIKDLGQILVFENGEIKEQGSHDELMFKNGLYAHMYNTSIEVSNYHFNNKEL